MMLLNGSSKLFTESEEIVHFYHPMGEQIAQEVAVFH